MKRLLTFLLVCFVVTPALYGAEEAESAPVEKIPAAELRAEKKAAAKWMKDYLANKKKAASLLKKVKDEKSAARAEKALSELYGLGNVGQKTALGEVGESKRPDYAGLDELLERNEKKISQYDSLIEKEQERIEAADCMTDKLEEAISKALE